jgi:hypothetical protein
MATTTAQTALAKLDNVRAQMRRIKEASQHTVKIGSHSFVTAGGGVIAGALDAKFPKLPNTNVDTAGVVGVLAILAGMSGMAGEYDDEAAAFGSGMLAYLAGRESREYFSR